ncbi:hypothetical protein Tco_1531389 [Tanacetum coccineum]
MLARCGTIVLVFQRTFATITYHEVSSLSISSYIPAMIVSLASREVLKLRDGFALKLTLKRVRLDAEMGWFGVLKWVVFGCSDEGCGTLSDQERLDFEKIMGNLLSSREVQQGTLSDQGTEHGTSKKIWEGYIDFESDPWPHVSATAKSRPSDSLTIHQDLCTLFPALGHLQALHIGITIANYI